MKIDKELSIYKEKRIVLWGASVGGERAYEILKRNGIQITALVDNDERKWGQLFCEHEIISPAELQQMVSRYGNVLVQISTFYEVDIAKQLNEMGIDNFISYSELLLIPELEMYLTFQSNPEFYQYYMENVHHPIIEVNYLWDAFFHSGSNWKSTVLCCMPPKTGNYTVFHGGKKYCPSEVLFVDTWHSSLHVREFLAMSNTPANKIITAVREPISQNLSLVFQVAQLLFWISRPFGKVIMKLCFKNFLKLRPGKNIRIVCIQSM